MSDLRKKIGKIVDEELCLQDGMGGETIIVGRKDVEDKIMKLFEEHNIKLKMEIKRLKEQK